MLTSELIKMVSSRLELFSKETNKRGKIEQNIFFDVRISEQYIRNILSKEFLICESEFGWSEKNVIKSMHKTDFFSKFRAEGGISRQWTQFLHCTMFLFYIKIETFFRICSCGLLDVWVNNRTALLWIECVSHGMWILIMASIILFQSQEPQINFFFSQIQMI